jgi:peroxiredoxin
MVRLETPVCEFGIAAPEFDLPGVDGKSWTLQDCLGSAGLVVMFLSNHCPYVQAIQHKLVRDASDLARLGVNSVAIMPNDTARYPADSFDNMKRVAREKQYPFPFLLDETQDVARAYGAVCTPDFFGYNSKLELQYRGRLDESTPGRPVERATRELYEAMILVAETGQGPARQIPSMGCSIKWRE